MDYRPWLANYPAGVPANINADQYDSLLAFIQECFNNNGKKEAFECMGAVLTYDKLDKLSTNFGAYLQSRGLEKGDKIALMMPNLLQYP
ncbi:MAG: AMP-binding protein, partial [Saprospiraceae bacterium]